jgi:hypothetical protein
MGSSGAGYLTLAAALSGMAALAHLGVVVGGPAWYRFFGAGEGMAQLASSGSWYPALLTLAIAAVLGVWSAYALSAAGVIMALPFQRLVLLLITSIYVLRGLAGFFLALFAPGSNGPAFWIWSSVICLLVGLVHAVGLTKQWALLSSGHG